MESFEKISLLILDRLREDIGKDDLFVLDEWIRSSPENAHLFNQLLNTDTLASKLAEFREIDSDTLWQRTLAKIEEDPAGIPWNKLRRSGRFSRLWKWVSVAAAVLLVGGGIYYLARPVTPRQLQSAVGTGEVNNSSAVLSSGTAGTTGSDKAQLELADGSVFVLDKLKKGFFAGQGSMRIEKTAEGELSYRARSTGSNGAAGYNILSTPRGGQYRLLLPDGTRVWLNAGSSLKYPADLGIRGRERRVELKGEAYFEVASVPIPFRVVIGSGREPAAGRRTGNFVEVLGTHFDIMAYDDEPAIRATLYAGMIRVRTGLSPVTLKPGQQAVFTDPGSAIRIEPASENAKSWVDGNISLDGQDLSSIMRQLSRWYDVDIEYAGKKPSLSLAGTISRNTPIGEVLKILNVQSEGRLEFSRADGGIIRVVNKE